MSDSDDGSNMSDDSFHGSEVCMCLFGAVIRHCFTSGLELSGEVDASD